MDAVQREIPPEEIARRAYELWQARGCPASDGSEDWRAAEAELLRARVPRNGDSQERLESWWSRVRTKIAVRNT